MQYVVYKRTENSWSVYAVKGRDRKRMSDWSIQRHAHIEAKRLNDEAARSVVVQ